MNSAEWLYTKGYEEGREAERKHLENRMKHMSDGLSYEFSRGMASAFEVIEKDIERGRSIEEIKVYAKEMKNALVKECREIKDRKIKEGAE